MWNDFLISLMIMGKGMAGIFIVIGILTVIVIAMGRLLRNKKEENSK